MTTVPPANPAIPAAPAPETGLTGFFHKLEAGFAKDEAWVVNEITNGWKLLQNVEAKVVAGVHTAQIDIEGIFQWIAAHQTTLLATFQAALGAAATLGGLIPGAGPSVVVATTAINAATDAINILSKSVISGSTPLSTAVTAFAAVKDASAAVTTVVKQATTKPASVSMATAALPLNTPAKVAKTSS
jgi:hypothetical protein